MANKYPGVTPRGKSIQLAFTYKGERCRETIRIPATPSNLKNASRKREAVLHAIELGHFDYAEHFPRSKNAIRLSSKKGRHTTIECALKSWLNQAEKYCQKSTIRGYSSATYYYLIPRFGHIPLEQLSRTEIIEWIDSLNISNKRKNNTLIPLRQVYEEAYMEGEISDNPLKRIKNLPVVSKPPQPFTQDEISRILEQLHGSERNMIQFAFWTGLRTSELIALKWENVDLEAGKVHIREAVVEGKTKGTKTSSGERTIELTDQALDALKQQAILKHISPYTFIDPKTNNRWKNDQFIRKRVWIPALKKAKIPYRNPYQTRHTFASTMLSMGKNPLWLQHQMGHKDWGMLRKVYARWIDNKG